ncbi:Transposon Ty3-I Gag-Pol polyprotein, partial [Smittium culicis]
NAESLLSSKEAEITELRNQLIQGESQFQSAAEEHHDVLAKLDNFRELLETESKKNAELVMQMTAMENTMLKREMELVKLKAELYERISVLQSGSALNGPGVDASGNAVKQISRLPVFEGKTIAFNRWINGVTEIFENYPMLKDFQKRALVVESLKGPARDWYDAEPDSNVANWNSFKEALNRQYGSLESTDQALERIDTLKLTMKSDFNSFIQQIRPSIKLIAGDNNTLAIAMLRKQVDPDIRKYVPKVANESFEEHEKRLKAHMHDSQAKFTSYSSRSNNMDIDSLSAPIQVDSDYAVAAAQYAPFNRQRQLATNYQRNPFQRSRQPHNRENTTMTKEQFDEYVKNSICFNCGTKGHLRSSCFKPRKPFRTMNVAVLEESGKDQAHFRVTVLLDSGSQITSISESAAIRLNLTFKNFKPLKLRMGNSSESATTNKITTAEICFGKTKYSTTFRVMPAQPFDVILGSNFIVAAEINYNPVNMTINFAQNDKTDSFSMMPSESKVTEWAPLVLAAGALDCLPSADPDIIKILRDVAELFNPIPSVVKTDFPHQLRLTTDQPCRARMRRYSPEETRILREHIKELYQAGYARPSFSPYSANPVIVPKADGSSRVVINFRPLNKITIRDEYPLPRID